MKNITTVVILAIVIVGVGAFIINKPEQSNESIKIGVIIPLTGQYAFLGESERNAMILAQQKFNNLELIFEDDGYNPKKGLSAYQKLTKVDNVDTIIAVSAPILEVLKPIVEKDNILLFSLGESLFHEDDTVFQLMPSSDDLGIRLGEEASNRHERIAVVYSSGGALWKEWRDDFFSGIDQDDTVKEFSFSSNSDLRTETQKVLAFNPDSTTVFLPIEDGIKYLRQLNLFDADHKIELICDGNIEFSIGKYIEEVGADIFNDCISTTLPNTMTSEFLEIYKSEFNSNDPILTADYAYDAISIIGELSKKQSSKWVNILNNEYSYKGASGEFKFNEFGTREPEVVVHQFKDGVFVEI